MSTEKNTAILLIVCKDKPGLVAVISTFVAKHHGNIVYSDQHTDVETNTFLMRVEWELDHFSLTREELDVELLALAQQHQLQTQLYFSNQTCRAAIMVSKYQHCLYDLLVRIKLSEMNMAIPLIISNHKDLKAVAKHFDIPFEYIPVEDKNKAEEKQLGLLKKHNVDTVILARYMQILSDNFIQHYKNAIINIHHSFLPAFKGAKPYHQAYEKGVKIIGATSHYVTKDLDMGPIIEQSVTRVTHSDRITDMIRKGRDQEKSALAYAVRMHSERRIITYYNKTVVFE
ncbi:MAG: formyltetrahydrofolate deformylase [Gammaproteobacteria bacterium]